MQVDVLGYVVAAIIAAGGVYGYFKAGKWENAHFCCCCVSVEFVQLPDMPI